MMADNSLTMADSFNELEVNKFHDGKRLDPIRLRYYPDLGRWGIEKLTEYVDSHGEVVSREWTCEVQTKRY